MDEYLKCSPAQCNGGVQSSECSHSNSLIVSRPCRNGTSHWVRQCQTCGSALGPWIKQNHLAPADMPQWNTDLQRRWHKRNQMELL